MTPISPIACISATWPVKRGIGECGPRAIPTARRPTIQPSSSFFASVIATAVANSITAAANIRRGMSTSFALVSGSSGYGSLWSRRPPRRRPEGYSDVEDHEQRQIGGLRPHLGPRRAHLVELQKSLDAGRARQ